MNKNLVARPEKTIFFFATPETLRFRKRITQSKTRSTEDRRANGQIVPALGFMALFVGYRQFMTTFGTATSQNSTTGWGLHPTAEPVFVSALADRRLESPFHNRNFFKECKDKEKKEEAQYKKQK